MNKYFYLIIILILAMCLCSCSKGVEEVADDTTVLVTEATENTTKSTTESTAQLTTETTSKPDTTTNNHHTTAKEATITQKPTTTQSSTKKDTTTENGCASGNHSMPTGNMGRWFNSRSELENYVSSVIESWNSKFSNGEITRKEYVKSCPQGYKSWSCSYCGKWTGNFKYDERKWCTEGGNNHWLYNYEIGWYSSYYDAEKAAEEYLKGHSEVGGYLIAQCDCGLYTATFYQK